MIRSKKEIFIFKNKYKYGEESIDIEDIKSEVIKSRNNKFLILDEEIYIKEYNKTKIKDIKLIIENEVKQEFDSDDYLIHFSVDYKNKKTLIYAIKGGVKILPFLDYIKRIEVNPIQFLILKYVRKKIRKQNFESIIEIEGKYYYIKVRNNRIIRNLVAISKDEIETIDNVVLGKFEFPFKSKNLIIGEK